MSPVATDAMVEKAAELSPEERSALRTVILALADSKRVLGLRYSDRMLGAPTLEAGIAASSMAQDEWGHARLTYALLGDFGDDPKALEHERPAAEYRSHPTLDAPLDTWPDFIAAMLAVDTALTAQYRALAESRYAPAHNRIQKMLDEERFHFAYAAGWVRRLAAVPELREALAVSLGRYLPEALRWLGDDEGGAVRRLLDAGFAPPTRPRSATACWHASVPCWRRRGWRTARGLEESAGEWTYVRALDFGGWHEGTRRTSGALDEETAARARGDKNRSLLLE
jgi:1,2-phenylacetyl-CoA epoxidase catalytic subunit